MSEIRAAVCDALRVGGNSADTRAWPATQSALADTAGPTPVHHPVLEIHLSSTLARTGPPMLTGTDSPNWPRR